MSPFVGLGALAFAYLVSQFYRTSIGVVAPEVAADLGLDATLLGTLSAAWFAAFAVMQFPIGLALDRFGPRRTASTLMSLAAIGAVVFARADGLAMAVLGQALIGAGCAPVFTSTMVSVSRWFPPDRFALLNSLVLASATGGILLSSRPFAMLAEAIGWRHSMLLVAGVTVLAQLLIALFAQGPRQLASSAKAETWADLIKGLGEVMRIRSLWPILPLSFTGYAVLIGVRGLWAGPYLDSVFGLSPVLRGDVLLAMSIAMLLGTLAYAAMERRWNNRWRPVLLGNVLLVATFVALAATGDRSLLLAAGLLSCAGAVGSTYVLVMAQARAFLPEHLVGRGITFVSFFSFAGVAVMQQLDGLVVQAGEDAHIAAPAVYGLLFLFMAAVLSAALVAYAFSDDTRPVREAS